MEYKSVKDSVFSFMAIKRLLHEKNGTIYHLISLFNDENAMIV